MTVNQFCDILEKLDEDKGIDLVYFVMRNLIAKELFHHIDSVLSLMDVTKFRTSVLLSILTITAMVKSQLVFRDEFFSRVKNHLVDDTDELLFGLK